MARMRADPRRGPSRSGVAFGRKGIGGVDTKAPKERGSVLGVGLRWEKEVSRPLQ